MDELTETIATCFRRWQLYDYKRSSRLPPAWRDALNNDPYMRNVVMVFDLVLGGASGRSVRIATVPVRSVSGNTNTRHDALPLLLSEPSLTTSYSLGSAVSAARQVDLSVDAAVFDPMGLIERGYFLAGLGEISLERADIENDYDQRYVLLRGDLSASSFGAFRQGRNRPLLREILTVQIMDPRGAVATRLPTWVLDTDRIPALPESGVGLTYPIIINSSLRAPAVRATDNATGGNKFIASEGTVTVDAVYVNGVLVSGGAYAYTIDIIEDGKGTTYTRISFTNMGTAWEDTDAVHASCTAAGSYGLDESLNPVQVIYKVVTEYSPFGVQGANPELFATALARWPQGLPVPRVVINASGGAAASVIDWIESGFLASYPMLSMIWARGGYGPVLTDFDASPVASFSAGSAPLFDRTSLIAETPKNDIVNEVVIRWGYDIMRDTWQGVTIRNESNSALCRLSRQLFDARPMTPIDSVYIADQATAEYVADWIIAHSALPFYLVEYDASPQMYLLHQCGDPVLLSDDDFGWVDKKAVIDSITMLRGKCVVMFRVKLQALDVGPGAGS